nr:zinc-dependent metalloprotease [Saprospiraceae bacterium]
MLNLLNKLFAVLIGLLVFTSGVFSQTTYSDLLPCATPPHKDEKLTYYQSNLGNYRFLTADTLLIPIKIHIVGTDEGTDYANEDFVVQAFCILNEYFEQASIQFYIHGDINYINNTEWYDHENFEPGRDMIAFNNYPGMLNSYIVQRAAGACGYYSRGVDGVVLAVNCLDPVNQTWAHEIGHQLTLPHTFYGWEGTTYNPQEPTPESLWFRNAWVPVETTDGSNCRDAGDGFCDTPIDYLSYRWSCSANNPLGLMLTDPLGSTSRVDGSYIMSYSSGACRAVFSEEQIQAMRMNLLLDRYDIIDFDTPLGKVSSNIEFLHPQNQQEVPFNQAYIEWKAVPNATKYLVQVSPLPIFSNLIFDKIVTDTFVQLPDLILGRNHLVRVKALSELQPCNDFSERISFMASEVSSVVLPDFPDYHFSFPTLLSSQENLQLQLTGGNESIEAQLRLISANGQVMRSKQVNLRDGSTTEINTFDLPSGIYLLHIQSAKGSLISKQVVIH